MPLIIIMQKFNNFCVTKSRLRPLQVKSIFLKPNESNNLLQHAKKHTFLLIFYTFFVYIFFLFRFIVAANVNSLRAWNFRSFHKIRVHYSLHLNRIQMLQIFCSPTTLEPNQTEPTIALAIMQPRSLHQCRWKKN